MYETMANPFCEPNVNMNQCTKNISREEDEIHKTAFAPKQLDCLQRQFGKAKLTEVRLLTIILCTLLVLHVSVSIFVYTR